jgi:oxygen-dependent protoporphyrinogen oxidase
MSPLGLARAAAEPLLPATVIGDDCSVGEFVERRFGRQVHDRFVEPLLGSLHAGDIDRLSLRAATPYLAASADRHRSLLLASRSRAASGALAFVTLASGLDGVVDRLARNSRITVHLGAPVTALEHRAHGWVLHRRADEARHADVVVLAVPAAPAGRLLGPVLGGPRDGGVTASDLLASQPVASVATVIAAYPAGALSERHRQTTGLLVPGAAGRTLKSAIISSRKWAHLDDGRTTLVRMSAGRARGPELPADDEALAAALHADLAELLGLSAAPQRVEVVRWADALPQLEVGHLARVAEVRRQVATVGGLVLAGASYDGVGIAACISSGGQAAADVLAMLAHRWEAA